MSKELRIEAPGVGHGTKIYLDGEDLCQKIKGIYGIEFKVFVDDVTRVTLHQVAPPVKVTTKAKVIEVFGEEDYMIVDREYFDGLLEEIAELKKPKKTEVK